MRILRFLLLSIVALSLVGGGLFLITREVLLSVAMSQLKTGVSSMRQLKLLPGAPAAQCTASALSDVPFGTVEAIQLVFTTDRTYQSEIICDTSFRDPKVIKTFTLPPFVTKKPGTAGLQWGELTSGVTLQIWGRERSILLENTVLSISNQPLPDNLSEGPVATCEGYGFSCCSTESDAGQGLQTTLVRDCPRSCYSQCQSLPVILSFSSQPFFDLATRHLAVASGDSVIFKFVADFGPKKAGTVTIDFGDGSNQLFTDATGSTEHTYFCPGGVCAFNATATVSDVEGVRSNQTTISQILIEVGQ